MDEKELKKANKDIKTLLNVYLDIISFEDKTNDMLREIILKSDGLDDNERERMEYACDCMDEMLDYAEKTTKLLKDYISPFGIPYVLFVFTKITEKHMMMPIISIVMLENPVIIKV